VAAAWRDVAGSGKHLSISGMAAFISGMAAGEAAARRRQMACGGSMA